MMKKKKKSAKKTTSNKVEITAGERTVLCNFDHMASQDAFVTVAETMRRNLLDALRSKQERSRLALDEPFFRWVYNLAKAGWNLSVLEDCDDATMSKYLDRDSKYSTLTEEENQLVLAAARCKKAKYPGDDLMVAKLTFRCAADGFDVRVDFNEDFARSQAVKQANALPRFADILDREAFEKALAGVPPEKRQAALDAELARQIERYNNTPQAGLGGLSPSEVLAGEKPAERSEAKGAPFYKLRIILKGTHVPVKRLVIVPSDLRLDRLHEVLQVVMGWRNSHLHKFHARKKNYGVPDPDFPELNILDEKRSCLSDLVMPESARFAYLYDFGDSWEHTVKVVDFDVQDVPEGRVFHCAAGKGGCPPEDVGGPWGYEEFCQKFNDPQHPEHDETLDWVYSWCGYPKTQTWPDGFSRAEVNAALRALAKRHKKTRAARKPKPKD